MVYSNENEEKIEDYEYTIDGPDVGMPVWFTVDLPPSAIARLNIYMKDSENIPANHSLAGNISESQYLKDTDDWFFKHYVEFMCKDFRQSNDFDLGGIMGHRNRFKHPYMLDSLWVNYQKQHEFNPPHTHAGIYSFVIFMKIPTKWEEQHALPFSGNSNAPRASDFTFDYMDCYGEPKSETFNMGPEWENKMLFFPAKLRHGVYPFFNCDEERITISGNVSYNTNITLRTEEEIAEAAKLRVPEYR